MQKTIPQLFLNASKQLPDATALLSSDQKHSWLQLARDILQRLETFKQLGVQPGDSVVHCAANGYAWIVIDLALHFSGAVHVPLHVTLSAEQIAQAARHSRAKLIVFENRMLQEKRGGVLDTDLQVVRSDAMLAGKAHWSDRGKKTHEVMADLQAAANRMQPDQLATILYTSGTTGSPKGVMLSQKNLASNAIAMRDVLGSAPDEIRLSVLPFSHIYARTCDLYLWLARGSVFVLSDFSDEARGNSENPAETVDHAHSNQAEKLLADCQRIHPTSFSAVPYYYEKIVTLLSEQSKKRGLKTIAEEAALLKEQLGGKLRRCSCGGAGLSRETNDWFAKRGVTVYCGYGLTEASPVVATSTENAFRPGSVGKLLPGVEAKITDGGELLVRGPNVMLGYWNDQAATEEALQSGWLHTGDFGRIDSDGFLFLEGRKKERLALSTGKKISPMQLEDQLVASPLIDQAMVLGEGQKYAAALVVPSAELLAPLERLRVCPEDATRALYERLQVEIAEQLSDFAEWEQLTAFYVTLQPFSVESGEMTNKGTLRREVILEKYASEIEGLFTE